MFCSAKMRSEFSEKVRQSHEIENEDDRRKTGWYDVNHCVEFSVCCWLY